MQLCTPIMAKDQTTVAIMLFLTITLVTSSSVAFAKIAYAQIINPKPLEF
jgi:hypothetical protein